MARTDLLVDLVKSWSTSDQTTFRRTLEAVIAEERSRQHHVLADRLESYLTPKPNGGSGVARPAWPSGAPIVELTPRRPLEEMILPESTRQACRELIEEQHRADILRANALEPRNRVLLAGPPGNGKTSLAEAIARELARPLLVVRYESIIGSYLGETAVRLAGLFDHVRMRQCVLFFDEFDAIGKERGDEHETGEIKRVVSSLLLKIDEMPSYVVIVVATNHPELLDRAVWRRFQLRLNLPAPSTRQLLEMLGMFENRAQLKLGLNASSLSRLKGLSLAEFEEFCLDVQRRVILAGGEADTKRILEERLQQWQRRYNPRR